MRIILPKPNRFLLLECKLLTVIYVTTSLFKYAICNPKKNLIFNVLSETLRAGARIEGKNHSGKDIVRS